MESYNELNGELITDRWNKTGATSDREMMEAKDTVMRNPKVKSDGNKEREK